MRKEIAVGLLVIMLSGLVTNALALWRSHAVVSEKVSSLEKSAEKQDNINTETAKKIDGIYWYLIESKGIKVPQRK